MKRRHPISMPEPIEDPRTPVQSSFKVAVGGQKFRLNFTVTAEEITDEPERPVLVMPGTKRKRVKPVPFSWKG